MKTSELISYFTEGVEVTSKSLQTIGMEIETMFVNSLPDPITHDGSFGSWIPGPVETRPYEPITVKQSQKIFEALSQRKDWKVAEKKGNMITKLTSTEGDVISYELGWHNIEIAVRPTLDPEFRKYGESALIKSAYKILHILCDTAEKVTDAAPFQRPTMKWPKDLLVIPDERDTTWLKLDGRRALNILAKTASVHFMITVEPWNAITILNELNRHRQQFLNVFPQDKLWKQYIASSHAGYRPDRYGGPCEFKDIEEYCKKLAEHDVVTPKGLVPFKRAKNIDIPLYLRSIWWYFRLRRFEDNLCIEVRPIPRMDWDLQHQMIFVINYVENALRAKMWKEDIIERV